MAFQMSSLAMSSIMSLKIPALASESVLQSSHHQRTKQQLPCKGIDNQKKTAGLPGKKKLQTWISTAAFACSPAELLARVKVVSVSALMPSRLVR